MISQWSSLLLSNHGIALYIQSTLCQELHFAWEGSTKLKDACTSQAVTCTDFHVHNDDYAIDKQTIISALHMPYICAVI